MGIGIRIGNDERGVDTAQRRKHYRELFGLARQAQRRRMKSHHDNRWRELNAQAATQLFPTHDRRLVKHIERGITRDVDTPPLFPRSNKTLRIRGHRDKVKVAHLRPHIDRKSTRLNSSHSQISYAVFCLKKKKK